MGAQAAAAMAPLPPPVPRWPTPPRSEASCGTTISEPQHSGSGGVLSTAGLASPEHSSRPSAMETSPGAVIAGGAQEGQQPLPDPLAAHPRYRKVRDLNWCEDAAAAACPAGQGL
jgi:hypothetical protein